MKKMVTFIILSTLFAVAPTQSRAQNNVNIDEKQAAAWQTFKAESGENWNITWNPQTGLPASVYGGLTKAYSGSPETIARSFLREHDALFGVDSTLSDLEHLVTKTNRGVRHVTFQQKYEDIPIEGGQYMVHIRENGQVDMANGRYYPEIKASTEPAINKIGALDIAKADLKLIAAAGEDNTADLVIYPTTDTTYTLAWKLTVFAEDPFTDWRYFVDAQTGAVLDKYNRVMDVTGTGNVYLTHPGISGATPTENLYRLNGNGHLQGTYANVLNSVNSRAYSPTSSFQYSTASTHFDEVNLYYHIDSYRHNYVANLGSLGFTQITAHAHANAFPGPNNAWFSQYTKNLYFGDGTGSGFNSFAREDKVIYHEYGHAVIYDIQSGIESRNSEEGAISEGVPDYFAGAYTGRSVILEYAAPFAKRNMQNPTISSYSQYKSTEDNEGEVPAHDGGEFFSSILWTIRNSSGTNSSQIDFLVFDALYRVSGDPDFLEYRNAMIAADNNAYSGAHVDLIQNIFAAKGIGSFVPPVIYLNPLGVNPSLSWSSVSGDISYKVYRGIFGLPYYTCPEDTGYTRIKTTQSTSFTDIEVGIDHLGDLLVCYYVTSVNTNEESYPSNIVNIRAMSPLKMIAPGEENEKNKESNPLPEHFALNRNYPNPFNPVTQISYALPEEAEVSITVYNIVGQQVAELVNRPMSAGWHRVSFEAGSLSSGMYFARMQAKGQSGTVFSKDIKMLLMK